MTNFSDIIYLDPNQITINRSSRQRQEIDISDIIDSIRDNGVINPIIVKSIIDPTIPATHVAGLLARGQQHELNELTSSITYQLIAGERRLEACKQLNIQAPCRLNTSLSDLNLQVMEFDENHKRKDLTWRELVNTVGKIHESSNHQFHSQTAKILNINEFKINQILNLYKHIDEEILTLADNLSQAISLLERFKSKKNENLKQNIKQILTTTPTPDYLTPQPKTTPLKPQIILPLNHPPHEITNNSNKSFTSILFLNEDFPTWIKSYNEIKFNLIHCDFSNDESFWPMTNGFFGNLNHILAPDAHILFWFNMTDYEKLKQIISGVGLDLIPQPFIWYKSDTKPSQIPDSPPKSTYEMCLIISHNKPKFQKQIQNAFHTPRASQPICPNQKSIPMLKYLFSAFIDTNTNFFDPSCNSYTSLLAAQELNPHHILGLESNPLQFQKIQEKLIRHEKLSNLLGK